MVTDEDAGELVKTLRKIAARNIKDRDDYESKYWKGQSDGRANAYNLAADWLEQIIREEADGE